MPKSLCLATQLSVLRMFAVIMIKHASTWVHFCLVIEAESEEGSLASSAFDVRNHLLSLTVHMQALGTSFAYLDRVTLGLALYLVLFMT